MKLIHLSVSVLLLIPPVSSLAQSPAFTYQGRLNNPSGSANGVFDFRCSLFDSPTNGVQVGGVLTNSSVSVSNGLFTTALNFGAAAFNGADRWLEIGVRTNGGGAFATLNPRQPLTATPYALYTPSAGGVASSNIVGVLAASQIPALDASKITTGTFTAAQIPILDAGTKLTGTLADARLSANVALLNGTNVFTGTNRFTGAVVATNVNSRFVGDFNGDGAGLSNLPPAGINGVLATTQIPTLDAGTKLSGTLADARLSANVALLNGTNVFTGTNHFTSAVLATNANSRFVGDFNGDAAGLSNLPPAGINGVLATTQIPILDAGTKLSGTLADARLSANVALLNDTNVFTGTNRFTGAVLATNVNSRFVGDFNGDGAGLSNLPPAAINGVLVTTQIPTLDAGTKLSGTLADARLTGNVALLNRAVQAFTGGTNSFSGNVGIGVSSPSAPLHINGGVKVNAANTLELGAGVAGKEANAGKLGYQVFTTNALDIVGAGTSGTNRQIKFWAEGGSTFSGEVTATVVTVTGGSDVAEPYQVASAGGVEPVAGMVVSIDPDQIGRMRVSDRAYDKTVAGILSGANGIAPGLTLRQAGTVADGALPVASIGRVWCHCDAEANGPIQAGDMLTTSDIPGCAMKVTDFSRANGSIIGKAMSPLKSGRGLVLVFVSLK